MTATFEENLEKAVKEVTELIIRKNHDYGPKNILNSPIEPELAIAVRLNDKIARLANLVRNGKVPKVEDESLRDTANDIIGYGIILKMVLDGTFDSPIDKNKILEVPF